MELTDEYEEAMKLDTPVKASEQKIKKASAGVGRRLCTYCKILGHVREECRKLLAKKEKDSSQADTLRTTQDGRRSHGDTPRNQEYRNRPPVKCFNCKEEGHIAVNSPGKCAMLCEGAAPSSMLDNWQSSGTVEGIGMYQALSPRINVVNSDKKLETCKVKHQPILKLWEYSRAFS